MPDLYKHGRKLQSIFQLLGEKENDITYSIGWALANSPLFCSGLLARLFPHSGHFSVESILLQECEGVNGITDVEIRGNNLHCIIEAKRDWSLPSNQQLSKYASRLAPALQTKALIVFSKCSHEYATRHLPASVEGIDVLYLSWEQLDQLAVAQAGKAGHVEKRLLRELSGYLRSFIVMQTISSNMVYVVSLAAGRPEQSSITWVDIVIKKSRYFHPFGRGGWPTIPPNYLGFRYQGRLQRIHHVESCQIVTNLNKFIPDLPSVEEEPFVLYELGPPIMPMHEVLTGNIFPSGRCWAMIDTLLTCKSVSEARDLTDRRLRTQSAFR